VAVIGSSLVLGCCLRRGCFRQHSRGAKLRRDHVYDVVQFAVGVMPDDLLGPRHSTDWRSDRDWQRKHQHDVPGDLFDTTNFLSVGLFARAASGTYRGAVTRTDNRSSGAVIFALVRRPPVISLTPRSIPRSSPSPFPWRTGRLRWSPRPGENRESQYCRCAG
jgi:hypothetical protein